jgi:hypothetical protein
MLDTVLVAYDQRAAGPSVEQRLALIIPHTRHPVEPLERIGETVRPGKAGRRELEAAILP